MIDLVLWDLDETLVPTAGLREVRHGKSPCDLTLVPAHGTVAPHDGVEEAIRRAAGVQTGLVTSSPRWYVDQLLSVHLPDAPFEVVVTYEDVSNIKPDPEPLLLAMARLRVPADRVLYIGDDLVDYEASRAAGVRFVGAGWADEPTFPREAERLAHPLDLVQLLEAA